MVPSARLSPAWIRLDTNGRTEKQQTVVFDFLVYQSKELRLVAPDYWRVLFKLFKNPRSGNRGRVWMDAEDWRIRRWVDETLGVDDEITTAAVVARKEMVYAPDQLGVLLPQRIVHSTFGKTAGKESPRTLRPLTRIRFTYEAFRRFEVSTATEIKKPGLDLEPFGN